MVRRSYFLVALVLTALACSSEPDDNGGSPTGAGGSGATSGDGPASGVTNGPSSGSGDFGAGVTTSAASGAGGGDSECKSVLEVIYRDFTEKHPDFEMPFRGDVVRRGLVKPELGADLKPQFLDRLGCQADLQTPLGCSGGNPTEPVIMSAMTFDQWYRDVEGVNMSILKELALEESAPGSGKYVFTSSDFFPLTAQEGFGGSPAGRDKNFLFTTEIHLKFGYVQGQQFSFRGDDDMWIFINNKLALDLGSMHGPESGVIDFDAQAADLGIYPGNTYSMDIFHAERHTEGSNFHIETNISCFTHVDVPL